VLKSSVLFRFCLFYGLCLGSRVPWHQEGPFCPPSVAFLAVGTAVAVVVFPVFAVVSVDEAVFPVLFAFVSAANVVFKLAVVLPVPVVVAVFTELEGVVAADVVLNIVEATVTAIAVLPVPDVMVAAKVVPLLLAVTAEFSAAASLSIAAFWACSCPLKAATSLLRPVNQPSVRFSHAAICCVRLNHMPVVSLLFSLVASEVVIRARAAHIPPIDALVQLASSVMVLFRLVARTEL
jgi:hypothetical protein